MNRENEWDCMRRMRFSAVACFFQVNQNKKIRILTRQIEIRSGRYILTKDMELPVSRLDGFTVYLIFVELRIIFVEIGMYHVRMYRRKKHCQSAGTQARNLRPMHAPLPRIGQAGRASPCTFVTSPPPLEGGRNCRQLYLPPPVLALG